MTPFDELVTSPELQAVKLLLPYLPASGRRPIAACVKFLELRQTLTLLGNRGGVSAQMFRKEPGASPLEILSALRPYLGKKECDTLDMILNLKDMMNMMDMMKNTSGGNTPPVDPMELLSGMLSPEQQEMFRTYDAMFSQASAGTDTVHTAEHDTGAGMKADGSINMDAVQNISGRKGDESDERMDEQPGHEGYGSGETGTDPDGGSSDRR